MATNPSAPVTTDPNAPKPGDPAGDDYTGVYGFFRRHQKKLLYTAGLFTLLTFSVTGPMMTMVGEWFGKKQELPTIRVGAERVALMPEDYQYGQLLQRFGQALAALGVLPPIGVGDGGSSELQDIYAVLRRVAITEGLDVSMDEVDRAIEAERGRSNVESAARLAGYRGFGSVAQMRDLTREAMRIGNFVRLQTLALDSSDARVLEQILDDKEKVAFRVARFDEKAYETKLGGETELSDDDLRTWLDGKNESEKRRMQIYGSNRLELGFRPPLTEEGQFDPTQWQEGPLKDFAPTEDVLRQLYEQEKATRFTQEDGTVKPFEDVQAELTRLKQAEAVANHLQAELRKQLEATLKPLTDELQRAQTELGESQSVFDTAKRKLAEGGDEAALQNEITQAEEAVQARQAAVEAAQTAVTTARSEWDFPAEFQKLTEGKSGAVVRRMEGRRSIEDLKDLDAAGVDLGTWTNAAQARGLTRKGDISFTPARTQKAMALYQVTDAELQPLKPWDELKPLLRDAWLTEKAKQEGETRKKALEDALLRLAKEKMQEQVTAIEGSLATKVEERMAEWRQTTEKGIAEAEQWLARLSSGADGQPPTQAQEAWQKKLDALRDQLAKADEHRATVEQQVREANEAEIAEAAKKHYHEVLEAAANEVGFEVLTVGPHSRELAQRPRFDKTYDPTTVFLFRNHADLEKEATTGIVQDATNRLWLAAVATDVAPLQVADVTRRQFELARASGGFDFADVQAYQAYAQAFTMEALEQRYDLRQVVGRQEVPPGPGAPPPVAPPQDK